jgi:hypothetical protein
MLITHGCPVHHGSDADGHGLREHNWTVGDPSIDCTDSHRVAGDCPLLFRREAVGNCSAFCNLGRGFSPLSCRILRLLRSKEVLFRIHARVLVLSSASATTSLSRNCLAAISASSTVSKGLSAQSTSGSQGGSEGWANQPELDFGGGGQRQPRGLVPACDCCESLMGRGGCPGCCRRGLLIARIGTEGSSPKLLPIRPKPGRTGPPERQPRNPASGPAP